MTFPELPGRLASVRERIAAAQARAGRSQAVTVVAVTKTFGPEAVRAAVAAGLHDVGENRVQEALPKQDALPELSVHWHPIGTLQQNKARRVVGRFSLVHSVDRLGLAHELDRRTAETRPPGGPRAGQLLGGAAEGPVQPAELPALLDAVRDCRRLELRGLMTMAELTDDEALQRRAFGMLRRLRDDATARGHALPELSMGMSGDFEVAVEEGATMVRLGTILFGTTRMTTDDSFQLTPHDIRGHEFPRTFRGDHPALVESFQQRVSEEFERALRERAQLEERMRGFQEQLRAFRDRERAMNEALLAAQQLRVDAEQQARKDAELILREARTEALQLLNEAQGQERLLRERTDVGKRQFAAFLANFRALLDGIGEVDGLQAYAQTAAQSQTEPVLKKQA